ncbi:MAG: helix-turn-helix domain-containing protein [Oscillospiraceae bacterium]|jgi:AraC-like DNA-binding protein|nr:helix-turn-helix domain-containing protein [Oscillospiraceae bacterium]
MEFPAPVTAVACMQRYIAAHLDEEISLDELAAAGYSKYHALRMFKDLTGRTPFETIRALRLTKAAQALQGSGGKVIDAALENRFGSHDGFTRAFARQFAITPQKYQRELPAAKWFISHPIEHYFILKEGQERKTAFVRKKESVPGVVTVTPIERPTRKLILKRAIHSTDYWTLCEEIGCDWEGIFNSIPEKIDLFRYCQLPPNLVTPGTCPVAFGVEVPLDYAKPLPEGCDVMELPPCTLLYFQTVPYEDPNGFGVAHEMMERAFDAYRPEMYGWAWAPELAPLYVFSATPETGARKAVPVKKA